MPLAVDEAILTGPGGGLLVWRWYWISGHRTSSAVWAKAIEAGEKLLLRQPYAAGIIVFTERDDDESARARLEEFLANGVSGDRIHPGGTVAMTVDGRPLIAHVIHRLDVGGMENGLVNLINRLPADRYRHADREPHATARILRSASLETTYPSSTSERSPVTTWVSIRACSGRFAA